MKAAVRGITIRGCNFFSVGHQVINHRGSRLGKFKCFYSWGEGGVGIGTSQKPLFYAFLFFLQIYINPAHISKKDDSKFKPVLLSWHSSVATSILTTIMDFCLQFQSCHLSFWQPATCCCQVWKFKTLYSFQCFLIARVFNLELTGGHSRNLGCTKCDNLLSMLHLTCD